MIIREIPLNSLDLNPMGYVWETVEKETNCGASNTN